ncbi:glycosyltransferase involved in cell wall biosynthesis [Gillisia mitskevichiae]|uniref:Glycosyltransferase involved in cell wall biosynthesis n=1 Tax=Gillisia mitskevichiae TaxID=270921 RepID=A0A495P7E5_9FLAO|nr:glycosyltransferase family A protein [Gillisia mitskevichiae]RKS45132.1 glycosyltransferase involved in cell wall biosynthesis [Gillisia mitskevichiae]
MRNPKISIIVPCYNQAPYLDDALQSVLDQTYSNWECIVVNDGSTDDTAYIVKDWLAKDKRFCYLEQGNKGVSNARNNGITRAEGEFILPLDADDKISKNYIELAILEFVENSNLKLVYCNAEKFGEVNGLWKLPTFSLSNLANENLIFSSALYKKVDWKRIDGYDEKMENGWEDWEFWISLLKDGGEVKKIDEIGFYYRIKQNSRNSNIKKNEAKQLYNYISIKHADFFVNQFGSFFELRVQIEKIKKHHQAQIQSEKYVIDLFFKTFFGFTLFGKYKR